METIGGLELLFALFSPLFLWVLFVVGFLLAARSVFVRFGKSDTGSGPE